jgi:primary-amine oxidase
MRSRQLVLSGYATVDNYDYLFHWIFGQDGAIDVQVQLTGVMNVRSGPPQDAAHEDEMMFAHLVAPRVNAPNHQHFFNWRLDFDVDGASNRVVELNTSNAQSRLKDRHRRVVRHAAHDAEERNERTSRPRSAGRAAMARREQQDERAGPATAYALVPGENTPSLQAPNSGPKRRAAFLEHPLWVTIADPHQMYASGEWVNIGPRSGRGVRRGATPIARSSIRTSCSGTHSRSCTCRGPKIGP